MERLSNKNNFIYMTVSLVVLLLVAAVVDQFPIPFGQHLVQALTILTVLSAVVEMHDSRFHINTRIGVVLAIGLIMILSILLDYSGLHIAHLSMLIAFYGWAIYLAARQILFTGAIDTNKMVGAICIYLLMGMIWALAYGLIAESSPGAFNGIEHKPWYDNFAQTAYYSFVTLTTLGYGDITPATPLAKFLVYMEAIVGVFYMAILVASLVGIRSSHLHHD